MIATQAKITIDFTKFLGQEGYAGKQFDMAFQASTFVVEEEYVDEAPGDSGDFKKGIEVRKLSPLQYVVESTARSKKGNANYPLYLYGGTGKLKGLPDFGYTSGHVRAGTVARGIGGIRPNKAAQRAKRDSEPLFIQKVNQYIAMVSHR